MKPRILHLRGQVMAEVNQKHTILYADDDRDDLHLLTEALKEIDSAHNIVEAFDGEDALKKLHQMKRENNLPCLIVLDVNMPKLDGRQTLMAIQKDEVLREIPVVIFSTSTSAIDKFFFQRNKVEYITKPINFRHLVDIASKMLSYCEG